MHKTVLVSFAAALLAACQPTTKSSGDQATSVEFIGELRQNDSTSVYFNARFGWDSLFVDNGPDETLKMALTGRDTLRANFPVFASALWLVKTDSGYSGKFFRTDQPGYELPLYLQPGKMTFAPVQRKWPSQFKIDRHLSDGRSMPALLQLSTDKGVLQGTIATSTGDSRYLTGWETANGFQLMGFDGRFIYRVEAQVKGDSIEGDIWAGMSGHYPFTGVANDSAKLDDPETMTQLAENYTHIEWQLPALSGDTVRFDSRSLERPTILAIQGSWCPNCMDEGRVLEQFYQEFQGELDIYGLSFEYSGTLEKATAAVQKMANDLGTTFPMVIATYDPKADHNAVLPLERIRSYPTSLILNKKGEVVRIHTGFYGPSTKEYEAYVSETRELLKELTSGE